MGQGWKEMNTSIFRLLWSNNWKSASYKKLLQPDEDIYEE